ncbi:MAG: tRNA-specific adenosine deaminase [Gemmatimonadetes bacterium RBG_16_66_8]|nr:MAG: tRNA-specific adenosine deaminase [Gemmatimonadetes bacterium RBG_16_66_8]
MSDHAFMQLAIARAREGIARGQTPFGACITRKGAVVSCEHNGVWATTDVTAHAEIRAIREACRRLDTIDLAECVIYSTCEPCPMCFSAIHWARIERIVFGASIADAKATGFSELTVSNTVMKQQGGSPVMLEEGLLRDDCLALFREWSARPDHRTY